MTIDFLSNAFGFNIGILNIVSVVLFVVLAPFVGGLLAGLDRKLSARLQGRVGPPVLQPFYDVFKLREKEDITVNKYQDFYMGAFLFFIVLTGAFFFAGGDLLLHPGNGGGISQRYLRGRCSSKCIGGQQGDNQHHTQYFE